MGLTRTVVFKAGSFPPEFDRNAIAAAFYNEFSSRYTVLSIQIVPGGVVKVLFDSPETKKALCSQSVCSIGSVECAVLNFMQRSTLVQVHHYPSEADDDDLRELLQGYGEIVGIRPQHWVGLQHITTGTRLVEMKLKYDIPRNLRLEKSRLKIWYKTQPLECDICQGAHKAAECDLRDKCRRCRLPGHFARDCPAGAWNGHAPVPPFVPAPASGSVVGDWADASSCEEADEPVSQSILQGVSESAVRGACNSGAVLQSVSSMDVDVSDNVVSNVNNGTNVSANVVSNVSVGQSNACISSNLSGSSNVNDTVASNEDDGNSTACKSSNLRVSKNVSPNVVSHVNDGNSTACKSSNLSASKNVRPTVVSNETIGSPSACESNDSVGPDLERSQFSSRDPMEEVVLSCVEDAQVVNTPLPTPVVEISLPGALEEGACVPSVESSDLDSGDSLDLRQLLSGRPSRSGKSAVERPRSPSPSVRSRSPGVAAPVAAPVAELAAQSAARSAGVRSCKKPVAKSITKPVAQSITKLVAKSAAATGAKRAARSAASSGVPGMHSMPSVLGNTPRPAKR